MDVILKCGRLRSFERVSVIVPFFVMLEILSFLLESALKIARNRVVVKRPRVAPVLSDLEPSYTLEGK